MPSSFAHGLVAAAGAAVCYPMGGLRFSAVAFVSAVIPDLDAIGRPLGLGDLEWLGGHRDVTHSLPFAAVLAAVAVAFACRGASGTGVGVPRGSSSPERAG